jgi:3-methyladenine DNA glycosylase Tag
MRNFEEIYAIAAKNKGGNNALESLLDKPLPQHEVASVTNDRWLSSMARSLFEAGFNWKVIDAKWDSFEAAFEGFETENIVQYRDRDIDRLLMNRQIVRNGAKIMAVIDNARFVSSLALEYGSAGTFFADWPDSDFIGLLEILRKRGSRLGGVTGQRALRRVGRSGFVLSQDVISRLVAEDVVAKPPSSKSDMQAVQAAFNRWSDESGRSLTQISQVLAKSI